MSIYTIEWDSQFPDNIRTTISHTKTMAYLNKVNQSHYVINGVWFTVFEIEHIEQDMAIAQEAMLSTIRAYKQGILDEAIARAKLIPNFN